MVHSFECFEDGPCPFEMIVGQLSKKMLLLNCLTNLQGTLIGFHSDVFLRIDLGSLILNEVLRLILLDHVSFRGLLISFGFFVSKLLKFLVFSLNIVLRQIAVLTHTSGVVGSVEMAASIGHLALSLAVVTVVAHVLGIVLSVCVRAEIDFSAFSLSWFSHRLHFFVN